MITVKSFLFLAVPSLQGGMWASLAAADGSLAVAHRLLSSRGVWAL